jgi:hypothetical protein
VQSVQAGFTPKDVFITEGQYIYKYDFLLGTISPTPFAQVGCPFSDHSSLTFDKVGTFGYKMIVACENGPIWTVDNLPGGPHVDFVASTTDLSHNPPILTHPEGPAIPPLSFGPLGGQILVADELDGQVHAIKNDGTVTLGVFSFFGAEGVHVITSHPCAFGNSGATFISALQQQSSIVKLSSSDFTGLGGSILVTSEEGAGIALITYDSGTQQYTKTTFDSTSLPYEGSAFVDCDVPCLSRRG